MAHTLELEVVLRHGSQIAKAVRTVHLRFTPFPGLMLQDSGWTFRLTDLGWDMDREVFSAISLHPELESESDFWRTVKAYRKAGWNIFDSGPKAR